MVSKTSATHAVRAERRWPPHSPTVSPPGAASPALTRCWLGFSRFFCLPIFDFGNKRKKTKEAVTVCLVIWTHLSLYPGKPFRVLTCLVLPSTSRDFSVLLSTRKMTSLPAWCRNMWQVSFPVLSTHLFIHIYPGGGRPVWVWWCSSGLDTLSWLTLHYALDLALESRFHWHLLPRTRQFCHFDFRASDSVHCLPLVIRQ